jgi:hypothetical protein
MSAKVWYSASYFQHWPDKKIKSVVTPLIKISPAADSYQVSAAGCSSFLYNEFQY